MENEDKKPEDDVDESLIEKAINAAKELRLANEEKKELLDREEKLKSLALLGGHSNAGSVQQQPDPEKEQMERINAWLSPTHLKI